MIKSFHRQNKIKFISKILTLFVIFFIGIDKKSLSEDKNNDLKNNFKYLEYIQKPIENDYIIGPGDTLAIRISRQLPELTNRYSIDGNGTIFMPYLERIYISGLTITELTEILNEKLKKYVKNPVIEISVIDHRPIRIVVKGEVETPGVHTLLGSLSIKNGNLNFSDPSSTSKNIKRFNTNSLFNKDNMGWPESALNQFNKPSLNSEDKLNSFNSDDSELGKYEPKLNFFPTVFDAIRKADGVTFYSDLSKIKIVRNNNMTNGGGKIETTINFLDVIEKGDSNQNIRIYDGDLIVINKSPIPISDQISSAVLSNLNPKFIRVVVTGRVIAPGSHAVSKQSTLNDALDIAGGTKILKGPVTFIRFNQDGTIDRRKFHISKRKKRGDKKNPFLKEGDIIFVGNSPFNIASEVITEFTRPFLGVYGTFKLFN